MAVPIDAAGNVDVRLLQRELSQALQQDREYKATDAMKKRAITQAKNYDEFRDMVACATLKPVSSAEIDELRQNKRGWAKKNAASKSGRASRLIAEDEGDATHPVVAAKPAKQAPKPKTTMDLERDWRRLPTDTEAKMRYLLSVGMKRCRRLFGVELGAELLEDVLRVLLNSFDAHSSSSGNGNDNEASDEASAESCHIDAETLLLWLEMLTNSHNFSTLSLAMVASELRQRVAETLTRIEIATEAALTDKAAVIARYTL